MDKHVKTLLQELARTCPATELQREDWHKLYEIALYGHMNGMVLTSRMVRVFLHDSGCSVQKAAYLSHQVDHLTTVLKLYDQRRNEPESS
jgi:hypothetical protein